MHQPEAIPQVAVEKLPVSRDRPARVRDDVAYVLPMLIFLAFTWIGGNWKSLYPATYIAKTVIVTIVLCLLWRQYTAIRWSHWWLGLMVGMVGVLQWVGMQLWLQNHFESFRPSPEAFDPTSFFSNTGAIYAFVAVRIAGAALLVPVMEELFWRDFLWRTILAPNEFKQTRVGAWDWRTVGVVCVAFSLVHGNWWLTSIVWASMIAWLLVRTGSLGACIIAHAVTNLLLAAYVLWTKSWSFW